MIELNTICVQFSQGFQMLCTILARALAVPSLSQGVQFLVCFALQYSTTTVHVLEIHNNNNSNKTILVSTPPSEFMNYPAANDPFCNETCRSIYHKTRTAGSYQYLFSAPGMLNTQTSFGSTGDLRLAAKINQKLFLILLQ
jgi:hypothetical protein